MIGLSTSGRHLRKMTSPAPPNRAIFTSNCSPDLSRCALATQTSHPSPDLITQCAGASGSRCKYRFCFHSSNGLGTAGTIVAEMVVECALPTKVICGEAETRKARATGHNVPDVFRPLLVVACIPRHIDGRDLPGKCGCQK